MVTRQKQRSEETRKLILTAAGKLFSKKGYDAVTMREVAKEAGCSHTTIYIYFKDKKTLLHELSQPPLKKLHHRLQQMTAEKKLSAEEKLKGISREFIYFCLQNRNMYTIFINTKSSRVDEIHPELEINQLRIDIFDIMKQTLKQCLPPSTDHQLLAFSRIYFYNIYGILSTYSYENESVDELMGRLTSTFNLTMDILILGFKEKINEGE